MGALLPLQYTAIGFGCTYLMSSSNRMCATKLRRRSQGESEILLSLGFGPNLYESVLICVPEYSAKDAVAALIKRLAHRNANVQLYTLEVRTLVQNTWNIPRTNSHISHSWAMLWHRTAARRYTANWLREASRIPYSALLVTEYVSSPSCI